MTKRELQRIVARLRREEAKLVDQQTAVLAELAALGIAKPGRPTRDRLRRWKAVFEAHGLNWRTGE